MGTSEASNPTSAWRLAAFNDSSWATGTTPIGYGSNAGFVPTTVIPSSSAGNYTSVFLRRTFNVTTPGNFSEITATVRADDGAIMWLNGVEVGRVNVGAGELVYNDVAIIADEDRTVTTVTNSSLLVAGVNVFAVQVFNANLTSSDLIVDATLDGVTDEEPPTLLALEPPASAIVQELTFINVTFSENVLGVNASDLLINNVAAASMTAVSGREYQFNFPQPPDGTVMVRFATVHGITDTSVANNAFAGANWTYNLDPDAEGSVVLINEFLASNDNGMRDDDGSREDWIELLNLGPLQVDLDGWFLTDDASNLTKFRLPSIRLFANEYLLIWASGKNRTNPAAQIHANFALSSNGEYLALVDSDTNVVSEFSPTYPAQFDDISYGRDRINPSLTGYFSTPTPRAANASSGSGVAPAPVFSMRGGVFTSNSLSLTMSAPSGTIRYTVNGTNPTEASPTYSGPIQITASTQVRARTFQTGLLPSAITQEAYNLIGTVPANFSSKLPILVINMGGQSIPANIPPGGLRPFGSLVVIDTFRGRADLTATPHFVGIAGMEVRGQTSAGFPKVPYRIELNDPNGNDLAFPLLGMPADSDWILRNPYSDKNFMNDFLTFEMYEQMGNYSVRRRLVEVFIDTNGGKLDYPSDYHGVFVLTETIKINGRRVDVARLGPNDNTEPNITGGYMWKKDKDSTGDLNFSTTGGGGFSSQALKFHDPKPREITVAQQNWLRTYLNTMESKLYAANWLTATGTNHWTHYFDMNSLVEQHWIVEFTKQIDGYRLSNYMTKDRGGKITMNPIWDWNLSWGNADYLEGGRASGWYYTQLGNTEHIWLRRLITGNTGGAGTAGDPDFVQAIIDRWAVLRAGIMNKDNIIERVEELYILLQEAANRDLTRWPRLGTYIWPNPNGAAGGWDVNFVGPTTYRGIIDEMNKWIRIRFDWIDARNGTPGTGAFAPAAPLLSQQGGPIGPGASVSIAGSGGTIYYTMDGSDPRLSGGGINTGSGQAYSGPITINGTARVVARIRDANNLWSAPTAATYVVGTPPLIISEIMYHPAAGPLGDTNDVDNFEYIELKNIGAATLSLAGYRFVNGIQFDFSNGDVASLPPGGKVLVVRNPGSFASRYPGVANIAGAYEGALDNAGERIVLLGPALETIHDFDYEDDWYPGTDGLGFALVVASESQPRENWDFKIGWRAGALNGSPGQDEPAAPDIPGVLITEALTHTDLPNVDAIELHNPTGQPVNVGGWFLSDDLRQPKFRIPDNTMIGADGYITFTEADFNPMGDPEGFNLRSSGDEVYLYSADGAGNLTGYVQGYDFGASLNGVSFGRHVNSQGKVFFVAQANNTLGMVNSGPQLGPVVISEMMYNPPEVLANGALWNNTEHEFVELYNLSGQPVSLNGTTNTWRLAGGASYQFPPDITLAVGEHILVVNFDPVADTAAANAFRSHYALGATPRLFGPYGGNLSNGGEEIRLVQPDVVRFYDTNIVVTSVLMDAVDYSDIPPWPVAADGIGSSLQKTAPGNFGSDPLSWVAARPSPGAQYVAGPAPVITQQPTNTTVVAFQTATFSVNVTGSGPFSYQWRFNGGNLPGATQATLTLDNVQPSQAGEYQVVVLNPANSVASTLANLNVLIPASIIAQPQGQEVDPGANVSLTVAATSSTPMTFQWYRDGVPIFGAVSSTLNLLNIQPVEGGVFQVKVTDAVGDIFSAPARVVVLVLPTIVVQPIGVTNLVGSKVILSVQVTNTATLPVGYRWRRGGATIANRVLNSYTDFYVFESLTLDDAAGYSVVVTNAASRARGIAGFLSELARLGVVTTGLDDDGDGIPNQWEIDNGLNPNSAADADLDADGDGYSNRDEYTAGTDPNNADSYLQVETIAATGGATIRFLAAENRSYSVQYRDSISGAGWITLTGVPIISASNNARMVTVTDTHPPVEGERYYRLVAPGVPGAEQP